MGTTCTVFHVWQASMEAVASELLIRRRANAYVSPATNGWVSLVEETADQQNLDYVTALAGELSASSRTSVLVMLEHASVVVMYYLYESGREVDRYASNPEFLELDSEQAKMWRGVPKTLLPYCVPGTREKDVDAVLRKPSGDREDNRLRDLATLLGLPVTRRTLRFSDFRLDRIVAMLTNRSRVRPAEKIDIDAIRTLADAARVFAENNLPGKDFVADSARFRFVGSRPSAVRHP